jgi:RimJ/RimL family protein N-acetyltransferase
MRACFDYAFNRLGCKVVVGMVPANNTLARRFDEHIGFTCNGEIPHGYGDDDLLIYTMTREECRWI